MREQVGNRGARDENQSQTTQMRSDSERIFQSIVFITHLTEHTLTQVLAV